MSSASFADLGVSSAAASALAERGFTTAFPIQSMVIPDVLEGHDVLVKSPTGSGKTLAFATPIADLIEADGRRPAALILAPTRELAAQIVEESRAVAHARALSITAVYGGVGIEPQARRAPRSHILVATPGRLLDLLDRRAITLDHVQVLVLDEADRMLDMGFRPVVERIVRLCPRDRQTLLFSATLDGEVGNLAAAYTRNPRRHELATAPERRSDVEHRFVHVQHEAKLAHLVTELRKDRGLALVFVRTKRGADRLVKRLMHHDVAAVAMHGDRTQSQREKALARFESGHVDTLVATDVAARGIDVAGVTHVINFDAPEDREGYVHRVGRTGRAGATGTGITFVMSDQARDISRIAHDLGLRSEFDEMRLEIEPAGRPQARGRGGSARNGSARNGSARNGSARNGASGNGASGNGTARGSSTGNGQPRTWSAKPSGRRRSR